MTSAYITIGHPDLESMLVLLRYALEASSYSDGLRAKHQVDEDVRIMYRQINQVVRFSIQDRTLRECDMIRLSTQLSDLFTAPRLWRDESQWIFESVGIQRQPQRMWVVMCIALSICIIIVLIVLIEGAGMVWSSIN
jgi:hypothetical protein